MTKSLLAKSAAWLGAAIWGASHFGLLPPHAAAVGIAIMGAGTHLASNTSKDRPNG